MPTDQNRRQELLDAINTKIDSGNATMTDLAYAAESYKNTDVSDLTTVYSGIELRDKIVTAMIGLVQAGGLSGEEMRLYSIASDGLLNSPPSTPTINNVPSTSGQNGSFDITLSGSTDPEAGAVTYEVEAVSGALTFSKTTAIAEGESVSVSTPAVAMDTSMTLRARAVDADGISSAWVSATFTVTANSAPTNPTNTGDFPSTISKGSTASFTFSGATDSDGTVTHYMVDQISSANLTVTTAEVAAGSAHEFTVGDISADESVTFRVRSKDDAGTYSSGVTVSVTLKAVVMFGLLWNNTDDVYQRIGIGIDTSHAEFTSWLSTTAARQNDHDGPTPGTQVAVSALTAELNTNTGLPFASRARVVMANDGTKSMFDHSTAPTSTQQIMTQTERYHYVQANITAGGKDYYLYAVSLREFALDVESDLGLSTPTIEIFDPGNGLSSGSVSGSVITSVNHSSFIYHDDTIMSWTYTGSFHSVTGRSTFGTGIKGTSNITRAAARTQHAAFGTGFHQRDFWARSAGALLALIEHGSWWFEGSGTKWDGYSWNSGASSYDQDNGLTLSLGNETGVILDGSGRVIASTYRGEENYHSALWEFIDGINLNGGAVYLAKAGAAYADDTSAAPYFAANVNCGTNTAWAYIASHHPGLFIPSASGGSSNTKLTDQYVNASGWRVLLVGGYLIYAGDSGLACWNGHLASSDASWTFVCRSCFRN